MKDTTIDECSSKISTLERESKRLKKDLESTSQITARVKELEKENREIIQQSMMDKRTLVALREVSSQIQKLVCFIMICCDLVFVISRVRVYNFNTCHVNMLDQMPLVQQMTCRWRH